MNQEFKEGAVPTPRTDGLMQNLEAMDALFPANAMFAHAQQLERELAEANVCERENFQRAEHNLARAEEAERRLSDTVRERDKWRERLDQIFDRAHEALHEASMDPHHWVDHVEAMGLLAADDDEETPK